MNYDPPPPLLRLSPHVSRQLSATSAGDDTLARPLRESAASERQGDGEGKEAQGLRECVCVRARGLASYCHTHCCKDITAKALSFQPG